MKTYGKISVVSDNFELLQFFIDCKEEYSNYDCDFFCTFQQNLPENLIELGVKPVDVNESLEKFLRYEVIFSIHCKQIFPKKLVDEVRCYNLHPGYNPYNRGYYPHVFSILNKLPAGVTLHRMDDKIDHGYIIDREEVKVEAWDTSFSLYRKVIEKEKIVLKRNIKKILEYNYKPIYAPDGNYNSLKDYQKLLKLNLNEKLTIKQTIDLLRAVTHPPYKNAYFIDEHTGKKIFVEIKLNLDEKE
ncbi:MAG: dTDP-4-amino-4,6-dideoxyglucose formyltransferase [Bacteroidia bacterium]|nr:dTDP-4-amino-4,6-dideoxyglucose formyltransferase [Bacteroidia bacterium]